MQSHADPALPPVPPKGGEPPALGDAALEVDASSSSSPSATATATAPSRPVEFYSTTTAPLRDHEAGAGPADARRRLRKASNNSIATAASVIDRPRPRPPSTSRPSSFYGIDATTTAAAGDDARDAPDDHDDHDRVEHLARGVHPSPSTEFQHRRSSFYGLEAHTAQPGSEDPAPAAATRQPLSSLALDRTHPQTHTSSGSGSGSYSSHELAPNRPRYSQAPYASSRAASLYGINVNVAGGDGGSGQPSPAPLLDQSHLQPGNLASLLSHDKTLELYRQNAKRTNDADVQFEFCAFVMEVVAELELAAALEKQQLRGGAGGDARGGGAGGEADEDELAGLNESQRESKRKQKALVTESITLLNKLAQRGHVKSQYFLGDCYTQGVGTLKGKRDYDKAFPLFMLAGKHGHADASFRAAQCLEHGWGCRKDQSKAVSLYRRAAVLSHPGSMHRLGLAEINGELGLTKRPKDGVQWLKRAAELADQVDPPQPQSLHELAILHEKGIDNVIFQDEEYAAELLARASELQFAPSAYKLGECYEYGKMGCPQDAALSIHYYNIAAQQNHPAACFALTAWYLVGSPGILPQSDTEAYLWAKKSAEMGFPKAEYACGYFTESGIGTYQDAREALDWFRKAASHGDKRALDRLRNAGQPIPAQVPALRSTPSSNALSSHGNPHLPALPDKNRSSSKLLTKSKQVPLPPVPRSQQPRSESTGRIPRPVDKDVKGKGREQRPDPSRPGFSRQRSNSQPTPFDARQQQQYYAPQQPAQPGPNDFNPLPYAHGQAATTGGRMQHPAYQHPQQQQQHPRHASSPVRPDQVRMPLRQQVNGVTSPDGTARDAGAKRAEREHVLQRRSKGGAEDKDCIVM
ncbi:hypothetical protein JCM11491_004127 [Sporobolomyces phaffii]